MSINKRPKKKRNIKDSIYDVNLSSSSSSTNIYGEENKGSESSNAQYGSVDEIEPWWSKNKGNALSVQLAGIQKASDDRADSEESNLDILNRGSRYTRKNKALKKFNAAKSEQG